MRLFTVFFLSGTLFIQLLTVLPSLVWLGLFLSASVIVAIFCKTRSKIITITLFVIIAFSSGLFLASFSAQNQLDNKIQNDFQGKDIILQGKVIDIPNHRGEGIRFRFKILKAYLAEEPHQELRMNGIVRLGWYQKNQEVRADEYWQLRVRLKRPSGFLNPGGFDYEKWLFTERINGTGYVRKSKEGENKILATPQWWSLNHLRETIHNSIQAKVTNYSSAAVLSALVVAVRTNLSDHQWDDLRKTGTTHLVAISGLHIAVVAGFAFFPIMLLWRVFPRLNERIPLRVAGGVAGVLFASLYAMLAGFTLPTQRALLMVIIALLGLLSRKHYSSSVILASAMLAVLLLDPLAGMTASFWLSFLAVTLILIFLNRQLEQPKFSLIKLQFVLSLGMLPLTLLFFGSASLSSPVANFLAIPWVSFVIVPVSLIALVFMPISSVISDGLFKLAALAIEWLFNGLGLMSSSSLSNINSAEIPNYYLLIAFLGLLFLLLPKGFPARWLGVIAFLPALLFSVEKPKHGEFQYTLLDAGQGMASVLQTQNHTLVYDAGTRLSDSFDIGKLVVIPYLNSKGINVLDKLIISHDDIDHSGGAPSIVKALKVNEIMSSSTAFLPDRKILKCVTGQTWVWDGVQFEILSPDKSTQGNDNNLSCVLKVSNELHSLLLTGDIEKKIEKRLVANESIRKKLNSDVMIVPHHGSKTSSHQEFIKAASPKLALIPAGYRSRFGHPKPEIVKRYQSLNIALKDTVSSGAIILKFPSNNQNMTTESYRQNNRRFWNRL